MDLAIGIDIGGTNTRVALVNHQYELVKRIQFPTNRDNPGACLQQINESIRSMTCSDIVGIGMSCPGPLDLEKGRIIFTPNLSASWHGFPLVGTLEASTGFQVNLENDANLAALAEAVAGAGKTNQYVHYLTISTGIGSGFIVNKKIFHGAHGFAGEVANACMWEKGPDGEHVCQGSIEAIASGTAITRRAGLMGLTVGHAGDVARLALEGDLQAKGLIEDAKDYLANFIGCICAIEDPDTVILGGSVALKLPGFIEEIQKRVIAKALPCMKCHINIQSAVLGEDSGLIGAAILANQKSKMWHGHKTEED